MKCSFCEYYSRTELSVREDEQKHSNREIAPNNLPRVVYCEKCIYLANSEHKKEIRFIHENGMLKGSVK